MSRLDDLRAWMAEPEDEHLEFKEAKNSFEFEDLVKYCVALANEGGGRMVLGVSDRRPRRVVGSRAFDPLERTKAGLVDEVTVRLAGDIQDERFLRFLEQVGRERLASFGLSDLLVLDALYRDRKVAESLKDRLGFLIEQGVVERIGRGRGVRYVLSRRFYGFLGKKGVYTRRRGLDRETNKALLVRHIEDNADEGSQLQELMQVLPALSRRQVQALLDDLRRESRVYPQGRTKAARWFPRLPGGAIAPDLGSNSIKEQ